MPPSPTKAPAPLTLAPEEDRPAAVDLAAPTEGATIAQKDMLRPLISVPGLVVACLVCLLLGSFLRSILSEADFVFYPLGQDDTGLYTEVRELRRLFQWRIGWDRDLVIALAKRSK